MKARRLSILIAPLCCLMCSQGLGAKEGLLSRGNAAYRKGDHEAAIELYESVDSREDYLARRFNAGVSYLGQGQLEEALSRFEDVSSRAQGELQSKAYYNLGYCHFQSGFTRSSKALGDEEIRKAFETEEIDDRTLETLLGELREAFKSYRSALDFYRKVHPSGEDTEHNIATTKTALIDIVDKVSRLQEMKRRREEREALQNPAELLRALIEKEKLHRGLARTQAKAGGGKVRIAARQLGKAEAENRLLTEKLLHYLEQEPGEGEQPLDEEEKKRRKSAADILKRAVEAQRGAESSYSRRDLGQASTLHSTAIAELRAARVYFPIQLPQLVQETISTQEIILGSSKALEYEQTGGLVGETRGSGFGKLIVGALKDKILKPLARMLAPSRTEERQQLAEDEEDVVWAAGIFEQAEIPPSPQGPADASGPGPAPPHGAGGPPQLDEEQARILSEAIRKEGATAREEAAKAREELIADDVEKAVRSEENALAAMKRIADLLPRPPETPEQKLRKLIERQKSAREAAEGTGELERETLEEAAGQLASSQREDGRVADEIARELEARTQDERARKALPKVREGEEHVHASAEALDHDQPREAGEAIDKDIDAFTEALALLTGQKSKEEEQGDQEQQQQQQQQQEKEKDQGSYALTPRQARMLKEQMDKKRREEESRLFSGRPTITVDKDW